MQPLELNLDSIRSGVLRFVYNIMLFASSMGSLISIIDSVSAFLRNDTGRLQGYLLSAIIGIAITFLFGCLRFIVLPRSLRWAYYLLCLCILAVASHLLLTIGTASALPALLLVVFVTISAIVQSGRVTFLMAGISITLVVIALLAHILGIVIPLPNTNEPAVGSTVMTVILIAAFYQLAQLGYSQIHSSYSKAAQYAAELDALNKDLDDQVKFRTKQLQESFERQTESLYTAAAAGRVSRALIHDLGTPLSVLRVTMDENISESGIDARELKKMQQESLQQILRILENSRAMMDGKQVKEEFNVYDVIQSVLSLIRHEIQTSSIKVVQRIPQNIMLVGIVAVFERIVMNILMNATEELAMVDRPQRWIELTGEELSDGFRLEITDNGRGIPRENWQRIFEPDYSTKGSGSNLGFGLTFVKGTIEKYYNGTIIIDSKIGQYTKFILHFQNQDAGKDK